MEAANDHRPELDVADLESGDAIHFDNTRGRPVSLRESGGSMVQTIPDGVCRTLALDGGAVPSILVHPRINAVTFLYNTD